MDVIKVLEENPEADASRLGVVGYAETPCGTCRFHAARLLQNRRIAPDWLKEECPYGSGEDCRKLVEETSGTTEVG
jgi:hypothetical protein